MAYFRQALAMIIILCTFFTNGTFHASANEDKKYVELSMEKKKQLLTEIAAKSEIPIPPEVLKAIAYVESGMMQFKDGQPYISEDGGIGMMQITERNLPNIDYERLKVDTEYNIEVGARILVRMYDYQNYDSIIIPKINDGDPSIIENWYFAIMAYNGLSHINDPNNVKAYQNTVFNRIKEKSNINLADFPSYTSTYQNGVQVFTDPVFKWKGANTYSSQVFKEGDKVVVMNDHDHDPPNVYDYGNLRSSVGTTGEVMSKVPYYTNLQIISGPYEDEEINNHFVYYEVKGTGYQGYMASSNLRSLNSNVHFENWGSTKDYVSEEKEWTITFNTTIDINSVNPRNIYIVDEDGNGIRSIVTLDDSGKVVNVKPRELLKRGKTYTLFIKNIMSTTKQLMTKPISKTFSVKK